MACGLRTANADDSFIGDVLIDDDKIVEVARGSIGNEKIRQENLEVFDASGKFVMPGGIDPHTHLEMPFMGQVACDDFFSGQAAALTGGTTMHIDFALPTDGSLMQGFRDYQVKANKSCMDYGFHMAVTAWNDQVAQDMEELTHLGINSFKFFLAYKGALMVTDDQFLEGLNKCKDIGAIAQVHAENGDAVAMGQKRVFESGITEPYGHALSRPAVLEGEATGRAIRLARFVGTPLYVVHVMSKDALEEVILGKQSGQKLIAEPVASGLSMEESKMWNTDFKEAAQYVMSPPIRSAEHRTILKQALAGGLLDLVATDHAVFNSTQKAVGKKDFRLIPNGVNGIEERLHVVWNEMVNSGMMSPQDFVRVTSTIAAKVFNLYPKKGVIQTGSDADVIIFDPNQKHTICAKSHHSKMDTNIYEDMEILGQVVTTISRGRVVWNNGKLLVNPGTGRFVKMSPFGYMFDNQKRSVGDDAKLQYHHEEL
eukprot:TRINITY_DN14807_c0_g5_i1.p1 TRINITY_DN14807_c0_g5~~TRINITY_DN14807_c0_g5_i1.p1  ORF type:complete len:483 (-),score=71.72 TRINITY_DN14807_c0_g5_i1:434-1882(-)